MIELEQCTWKRERERGRNYTLVMQRHDCVDQTLTVLSSPADTSSFPLAPKRMALMLSVWEGTASESSVKETAEPALRVYQYNKRVEVRWEKWSFAYRRSKMRRWWPTATATATELWSGWTAMSAGATSVSFLGSESMLPLRN